MTDPFRFPPTDAFTPVQLDAFTLRAPIDEPVQTSFGIMYDRPAVWLKVTDADGAFGWGEVWCNFPSVGAEHRARLVESCVAPLVLNKEWTSPVQAFEHMSAALAVLALQTGEPGPIAQAVAGVDMALWDLCARRQSVPLWKLFGGVPAVPVYASGLSPTRPEALAQVKHEQGYRAFKLKVGFGLERDESNLATLRALLGDDTPIMIDANQAWSLEQAIEASHRLAPLSPAWLEEPMRADTDWATWQRLAQAVPLVLAGGENWRGEQQFSEGIGGGAFGVIQPDMGKWGGFSACVPVGRQALAAGRRFCPHWLGGGIGLVASMHLKAAVGGNDPVEVDSNPNPLRDIPAEPFLFPREGVVTLNDEPGLGMVPDMQQLARYVVPHR